MIEKHFTLSRTEGGPDSSFSLEFDEFKAMVQAIRNVEKALGTVKYGPIRREKASKRYRRSLFVTESIKSGEMLTERNIRSIRPGDGLSPVYQPKVLGRKVLSDLPLGIPLKWEHIDWTK
jgi:sialic acid synthase SpsE